MEFPVQVCTPPVSLHCSEGVKHMGRPHMFISALWAKSAQLWETPGARMLKDCSGQVLPTQEQKEHVNA